MVADRGFSSLGVSGSKYPTKRASHDFVGNIDRSVEPSVILPHDAPLAQLVIQGLTTAADRKGTRLAKRLAKKSARVFDLSQKRVARRDMREAWLKTPTTSAWLDAANDLSRKAAMIGAMTRWMHSAVATLLAIIMLVNDPLFVLTATQNAMDISEAGRYDFSNPAVLASFAVAAGVSTTLLLFATLFGHGAAHLFYTKRYKDLSAKYPELYATKKAIPAFHSSVILIVCLLVLIGTLVFLHQIAAARFNDLLSSLNGGGINNSLVWWMTLMPAIFAFTEMIKNHPILRHSDLTARKVRKFNRMSAKDVRNDKKQAAAVTRSFRDAQMAASTLQDFLNGISLTANLQIAEGAIRTGAVNASGIVNTMLPLTTDGTDEYSNLSGKICIGDSTTIMAGSHIRNAVKAFEEINIPIENNLMGELWSEAFKVESPNADIVTISTFEN